MFTSTPVAVVAGIFEGDIARESVKERGREKVSTNLFEGFPKPSNDNLSFYMIVS